MEKDGRKCRVKKDRDQIFAPVKTGRVLGAGKREETDWGNNKEGLRGERSLQPSKKPSPYKGTV